jgi:hypothetical protein
MGKSRRPNKTGRNKGLFLALPHSVLDSAAFRSLSSAGKIVVLAVARAHNFQTNDNGKIPFGERGGAAWGLSQKTTRRALVEAEAADLIRKTQRGSYETKLVTLWQVAWHPLAKDAVIADSEVLSSGKNAHPRGKNGRWAPRHQNEIAGIEANSAADNRKSEAA